MDGEALIMRMDGDIHITDTVDTGVTIPIIALGDIHIMETDIAIIIIEALQIDVLLILYVLRTETVSIREPVPAVET